MREIVESFVVETQEIFDDLNNDLLRLEQAEDPSPLIDKIFRAVHTVKGTSGFLNLEQLSILTHHFEDVLNRLRKGALTFHPGMLDVMFGAFDLMNVLLQQILDEQIQSLPLEGLLADLISLAEDGYHAEHVSHLGPENRTPAVHTAGDEGEPAGLESVAGASGESRLQQVRRSESVRVSVERLDDLLSLVGELVLTRNRLARLVGDVDNADGVRDSSSQLAETSAQIDFITSELQSAVMRTRMVPVGRVFSKFPRIAHDLARDLGKKVELEIEGGETELDKSLVDEIGDPLLHLIRNAIDHGIEPPAERRRRGKPEKGRILLRAAHEGDRIVITVEDDGAGIDSEVMRSKAVGRGILTDDEAISLKESEVFDLIFRPGFSTLEKATRVSGRGVGMDVVKTIIGRMNSNVRVDSTAGTGTTFTLRLPLTLAIIHCLLVESGGETYALPLHAVREVLALENPTTVRGRPIVRLRDQIVPLIELSEAFGLSATSSPKRYVAVVHLNQEQFGIIVDGLLGQEEIVIKPLGSFLKTIGGFSGSTVLGDGRVVMVLDTAAVIQMGLSRTGTAYTVEAA
ncbi:MAG: chemotaxis protein CheA [Rhodothermales bacterium]